MYNCQGKQFFHVLIETNKPIDITEHDEDVINDAIVNLIAENINGDIDDLEFYEGGFFKGINNAGEYCCEFSNVVYGKEDYHPEYWRTANGDNDSGEPAWSEIELMNVPNEINARNVLEGLKSIVLDNGEKFPVVSVKYCFCDEDDIETEPIY